MQIYRIQFQTGLISCFSFQVQINFFLFIRGINPDYGYTRLLIIFGKVIFESDLGDLVRTKTKNLIKKKCEKYKNSSNCKICQYFLKKFSLNLLIVRNPWKFQPHSRLRIKSYPANVQKENWREASSFDSLQISSSNQFIVFYLPEICCFCIVSKMLKISITSRWMY